MWYVYILLKEGKIVYVGCSSKLEQRFRQHKSNKDFDSFRVQYQCGFKEKAFMVEKTILNFLIDNNQRPIYNIEKSSFVADNEIRPLTDAIYFN